MLQKKYRVLSETITSVEDPIEYTQKGQVTLTKSNSTDLFIPTTIKKPKLVSLTPHSTLSASAQAGTLPYYELLTSNVPEDGMKLYSAASAKELGSYLTSATLDDTVYGQMFVGSDNKLYRRKTRTGRAGSIGAVLASATLKATHLEEVPYTNEVQFIRAKGVNATAGLYAFSFEVKGY